jgi:hypothetical protein
MKDFKDKVAAAQMLEAVRLNKRRVLIGRDAKALDLISRVLGSHYQGLGKFRKAMRERASQGTGQAAFAGLSDASDPRSS